MLLRELRLVRNLDLPIFTDYVLLQVEGKAVDKFSPISLNCLKLPLTREKIVSAQTVDLTLRKCFSAVVSLLLFQEAQKKKICLFC